MTVIQENAVRFLNRIKNLQYRFVMIFQWPAVALIKVFSERSSKNEKMRGQSFSGDGSKKSRSKFWFSIFYRVTGDLMLEMIMPKMMSNYDGGANFLRHSL